MSSIETSSPISAAGMRATHLFAAALFASGFAFLAGCGFAAVLLGVLR